MKKALESYDKDWNVVFDKVIKQNENGRFVIDNFIAYVLPNNITNLHTCHYPLVIFKDNEIIDIDEWWYSPFKKVLNEGYRCLALTNFDDIDSTLENTSLGYVEEEFAVRCKIPDSTDSPLVAMKVTNITFNMDK